MLLTLNELDVSDECYLKLKEDFFVFPVGDNSKGRLELQIKSKQRINDIVMFHRYVMEVYYHNREHYDPVYKEFNKHNLNIFDDIPEEHKHSARMSFPNYNWNVEIEQVKAIANESLIINLWVTIEQFTNRTLNLINPDAKSSHRWDEVKNSFLKKHIDLTSLNSYDVIDELRVVNNKLKHLYFVDEQLAKFNHFKDYKGKSLNSVSFNLQDYITSSYHFLYKLNNIIGETEYYPE
jgi:hypothetical protein